MNLIMGGLLFLIGLAVTIGTAAGGGYLIVAYGAILAGAVQFCVGLARGEAGEGGGRRLIFWVPLLVFVIVIGFIVRGLYAPASRNIQSGLVGQPVPEFALAPGMPGRPGLSSAALRQGRPRLVNIFASWCIPCRIEAPQLEALARAGVPIDGIAVRDRPQDLAGFLAAYGDPFATIGADTDRRVQMELGSAGVPETFVIDGDGIIRHQHIGAIMPQDMNAILQAYEAAR